MSNIRKSVVEDPTVRAAIDALRDAVLAVNGDPEIVGMITLIQIGSPEGVRLVSDVRSCSCMSCIGVNYRHFSEAMASHVKNAADRGEGAQH